MIETITAQHQVDAAAQANQMLDSLLANGNARAVAENKEFFNIVGPEQILNVGSRIAAIARDYQAYEEGKKQSIAHTRLQKLQIIGKCYVEYRQYKGQRSGEQKRIEGDLIEYMEQHGITCTPKTMISSKILMCVFVGADPKKINVYCKAFEYANKYMKADENFADFVIREGGLEEIRKKVAAEKKYPSADKAPPLSREDKLENAFLSASKLNIAMFECSELSKVITPEYADKLVLIVTQVKGGVYQVNAAVPNKGVIDAALLAFYKANAEEEAGKTQVDSVVNERVKQDNAINQMVANQAM